MRVRPLTREDYKAWLPLWRGYQTFYETDIPMETTKVSFDRMVGDDDQMGGFALEDDRGDLLGIVHWIRHRSTWTVGDYCYLQDLFVADHARNGGHGRKLIEAVYDHARAVGCSRVYWLTHETNEAAMKLYDKVADRSGFLQYRKIF